MENKNVLSKERQGKISVNSRNQLSTTVEGFFAGAIAKVKAEAAETIARGKAQADEKAREYTDAIAKIKSKTEKKAKAYAGTVGKGRASTAIEALFSDGVAKQKVKSEAEAEKEKEEVQPGEVDPSDDEEGPEVIIVSKKENSEQSEEIIEE